MNSSKISPTSYLISIRNSKSTSDKVDLIFDAFEDIISTFKTQGSPEANQLLCKILERNRLEGGSPLATVSIGVSDSYDQTNKASS